MAGLLGVSAQCRTSLRSLRGCRPPHWVARTSAGVHSLLPSPFLSQARLSTDPPAWLTWPWGLLFKPSLRHTSAQKSTWHTVSTKSTVIIVIATQTQHTDLVLVPTSGPSPPKPLLKGQQLGQGLPHLGTHIQSFPDTSHSSALKTVEGQKPKLAKERIYHPLCSVLSSQPGAIFTGGGHEFLLI